MKHLKEAIYSLNYQPEEDTDGNVYTEYLNIKNNKLEITIQDGPIGECGVNGVQITDVLEYIKEVYQSLNKAYPCRENSLTITKIEEALHWQEARTRDRVKRNVEGYNKA